MEKERKMESKSFGGVVSVLVFRREEEWVAKCLEYPVSAQADRLIELPEMFAQLLAEYVLVSRSYKQDAIQRSEPVSQEEFQNYKDGVRLDMQQTRVPVYGEVQGSIPMPLVDMRIHG